MIRIENFYVLTSFGLNSIDLQKHGVKEQNAYAQTEYEWTL